VIIIKWLECNSIEDLIKKANKEISRDLEESLLDSAHSLEHLITQKVEYWYSSRSPSTYNDRTYQVLKAIRVGAVKKVLNTYSIEVYFDGDALTQVVSAGNNGWVSHKETNGQRYLSGGKFNFWDMMENGWHLPNGSQTFEGHGAIDFAETWIEVGKFAKDFKYWLEEKGYVLTKNI
jgi:hypothetical protein